MHATHLRGFEHGEVAESARHACGRAAPRERVRETHGRRGQVEAVAVRLRVQLRTDVSRVNNMPQNNKSFRIYSMQFSKEYR